MSIYRIKMNGKIYEMEVELVDEGKSKPNDSTQKNTSELKAQAKAYSQTSSNTAKSDSGLGNGNIVKAPMAGRIVETLVSIGDSVDADDTILILEAMKMENEVCSPYKGVIKNIFVSAGQAVSGGDDLFEVAKEDK